MIMLWGHQQLMLSEGSLLFATLLIQHFMLRARISECRLQKHVNGVKPHCYICANIAAVECNIGQSLLILNPTLTLHPIVESLWRVTKE
jgi:hypothetical protein